MHLFAEILEKHNREKFRVFCFSFGPPYEDHWRERAKNACDEFIDVRSLSDLEIAKLAREKEIDIAIDLKGFTEDCRPSSFAHRAAPVQINYLGYPGTMASPYVDYVVADKILIDEESKNIIKKKLFIYLTVISQIAQKEIYPQTPQAVRNLVCQRKLLYFVASTATIK